MNTAVEILVRVLEAYASESEEALANLSALRLARAGGKEYEDARRRLLNPRLNTTLPVDVVRGLDARILGYRDTLQKHLGAATDAAIKLEFAQAELDLCVHGQSRWQANAVLTKQFKMYPMARGLVDALHEVHHVGERHYEVLTQDDVAAIASLVNNRYDRFVAAQQQESSLATGS